jgi:acyl carrier protein
MSTVDQVKAIIAEQLGRDLHEVGLDASFVRDLGADSLDLSQCVVAFEQTFQIKISPEDAMKIRSVRNAVEYIDASTSAAPRK